DERDVSATRTGRGARGIDATGHDHASAVGLEDDLVAAHRLASGDGDVLAPEPELEGSIEAPAMQQCIHRREAGAGGECRRIEREGSALVPGGGSAGERSLKSGRSSAGEDE